MAKILSNRLEIEYDTFGDQTAPPLILIAGLGGQMIIWSSDFCRVLAEKGLWVIRFDNRDTGLSTKIEEPGAPDSDTLLTLLGRGEKIKIPYSLEDMAADAIGLMDGLGIEKAHICGASMGGMIGQIMAIRSPERVLSLTSIASATGNPEIRRDRITEVETPYSKPLPVPSKREEYIEYMVRGLRALSGPGFPYNEAEISELAGQLFDRSFYPEGAARQLLAVLTAGNRKPALLKTNIPALIIHGDSDPLVPVECGYDTAEAIPGAELLIIKGMGHDLPKGAWPQIIEAIIKRTRSQAVK